MLDDKEEPCVIDSEKNRILTEIHRDSSSIKWIFVGVVYSQIINMVTCNKNRRNATSLFTMQIQGTYVEVTGVHDPRTLYAFSGIKEKLLKILQFFVFLLLESSPTY